MSSPLKCSGDVDHYIAGLAEDRPATRQYLKIVDALRNAGRAAEAEHWAQRGLEIGNPIVTHRLGDVYTDLLLDRGATEKAFAWRWQPRLPQLVVTRDPGFAV